MSADQTDKVVEQVLITQEDLDNSKYAFGIGVKYSKRIGVSQSKASRDVSGSKSESQVNMIIDLSALTLKDLVNDADYKYGVNARASFRDHKWIPKHGTTVGVKAIHGGRVRLEDLPPEVMAIAIFSHLEEPHRSKAIAAFMSTQ